MAENITEFREMDENGNNIPEETPKASTTQPDAPKKGLLALWKNLKWWQKAAVIAGTATLIYVGGKWIFKGRKQAETRAIAKWNNEHEVEGQRILDALENAQQVKVVTPMDPVNNVADAAVQGLVNEMANTAEVVNF